MKMSKTDEKAYPKLYYYVKHNLPEVIKVPKIVASLKKNGEIKKKDLRTILKYGTEPTIKVTTLSNACGEFTPNSSSNELRLHKSLVEKFEKKTSDKILLMTVGATILHELAHWGDDQDGIDLAGEEGELFEKEAYKLAKHHCSLYATKLTAKGVVF